MVGGMRHHGPIQENRRDAIMKTIERRGSGHCCVIAILYGICLAYCILLLLVKLVAFAHDLVADALEVLQEVAVHFDGFTASGSARSRSGREQASTLRGWVTTETRLSSGWYVLSATG